MHGFMSFVFRMQLLMFYPTKQRKQNGYAPSLSSVFAENNW